MAFLAPKPHFTQRVPLVLWQYSSAFLEEIQRENGMKGFAISFQAQDHIFILLLYKKNLLALLLPCRRRKLQFCCCCCHMDGKYAIKVAEVCTGGLFFIMSLLLEYMERMVKNTIKVFHAMKFESNGLTGKTKLVVRDSTWFFRSSFQDTLQCITILACKRSRLSRKGKICLSRTQRRQNLPAKLQMLFAKSWQNFVKDYCCKPASSSSITYSLLCWLYIYIQLPSQTKTRLQLCTSSVWT